MDEKNTEAAGEEKPGVDAQASGEPAQEPQESVPEFAPDAAIPSTAATPPRRRWLWIVVVIVILIILGGLAYGGWCGWQWYQGRQQARVQQRHALTQKLQATQTQVQQLEKQFSAQGAAVKQAAGATKALQKRVTTLQKKLQDVDQVLNGGKRGVQTAIVEQLLLAANDAVQIGHDPVAAGKALAAADKHLAGLHDPRFFDVRKAIASERQALKAVRQPDMTGAAIAIGQFLEDVPRLPFNGPAETVSQPAAPASAGQAQSGWARGWTHIVQSLSALFSVRHHVQPVKPLLPDAQKRLIGAVLDLRLDGARVALLQRDTKVFHSQLASANQWLQRYYRDDAPQVQVMQAGLEKLAKMDLAPSMPDISASLDLLRKQQNQVVE